MNDNNNIKYTSMDCISAPLQKTESTQTEIVDPSAKRKSAVYDKVDNTKRCELIRIVFLPMFFAGIVQNLNLNKMSPTF